MKHCSAMKYFDETFLEVNTLFEYLTFNFEGDILGKRFYSLHAIHLAIYTFHEEKIKFMPQKLFASIILQINVSKQFIFWDQLTRDTNSPVHSDPTISYGPYAHQYHLKLR